MSERVEPKEGWYMGQWCNQPPRPWLVGLTTDGVMMGSDGGCEMVLARVDDPRWTWCYRIPSQGEWEAMGDVIETSLCAISGMSVTATSVAEKREQQELRKAYFDARAKLESLKGGERENS